MNYKDTEVSDNHSVMIFKVHILSIQGFRFSDNVLWE